MAEPGAPENFEESKDNAEAFVKETETAPNYRQQRKIMGYMLSDGKVSTILSAFDVPITQSERDEALKKISQTASSQTTNEMLNRISTGLGSDPAPERITEIFGMLDNTKAREIIATIQTGNFGNSDRVTPDSISEILKMYPMPGDIETIFADDNYIPKDNVRDFLKNLYGKRWEYWEQLKLLQKEAKEKYGKPTDGDIKEATSNAPQVENTAETKQSEYQLERIKQELDNIEIQTPPPIPSVSSEKKAISQKNTSLTRKILNNSRLLTISAFQLGGLHPQRIDGKWEWVIEPWARVSDDPRQRSTENFDKYIDIALDEKERGAKVLDYEKLGGENPDVWPSGLWGLQLVDHRRIKAAQAAGVAIEVNITDANSKN